MNERECRTHGWLDVIWISLVGMWLPIPHGQWCALCGAWR